MFYYEVYLRGIFGLYTWSFEEELNLGARVTVLFRGRKKMGVVVGKTREEPDFKAQSIQEVVDESFIPANYILLARQVARDNFCFVGKVLNLVVPRKYFLEKDAQPN